MGRCLSIPSNPRERVASKEHDDHLLDISKPSSLPMAALVSSSLPVLKKAKGHYLYLSNGEKLLDGCGGAGVACIGHGRPDVAKVMNTQANKFSYVSWTHFDNEPTRDLSDWLLKSTGGKMGMAYIMCSGSEVVEAALKLAREYHLWTNQPRRVNFVSRDESYHGTTIGALSLSGHVIRRAPFEPLLLGQRHSISSCNPYRQQAANESDAKFLSRKIDELEAKFQQLGPETVAAVILEPVVGAALGCVPAVPGYLSAVRRVCDRHGALLIFDEVMCGMGRTGTLHAWEREGEVPDLQTLGKGLAGGYQPASALLVSRKLSSLMEREGRVFTHGHTYQNHPVVAAAALKVQRIIQEEGMLVNVRRQAEFLEGLLRKRLGGHPNVGDIRGRGLFWGVEFVKDRESKEPFEPGLQVAAKVQKMAQTGKPSVLVYHGQGCAGGGVGDHVMIMPAYDVDERVVEMIVEGVAIAVERVFRELRE